MKKIGLLLSVVTLLFATSCTTDKDSYVVKGTVAGNDFNGKEVFLQELTEDGRGFTSLDTATIENGTFTFKGKAGEKPQVRFVAVADSPYRPALFVLENGNIEINIDTVSSVKGTAMNDKYQEVTNKLEAINKKLRNIGEEYQKAAANGTLTPEMEEKSSKEMQENSKEMTNILYEYTKENIQNPIGEFFFLTVVSGLEEEQQKELLAMTTNEFRQKDNVKQLEEHFKLMENSAIGKMFIDVKGLTPAGKEVSLSDYAGKGKIVLIDFWASWCGPCVREMPTVVEAYKKYKNKGFEVVGISLDEDKAAWEKAIKNLGITWPQMSDLKGWGSELSAPYGVRGIPYTILLDKDGKIIEKNLRGHELLSKLDELLK